MWGALKTKLSNILKFGSKTAAEKVVKQTKEEVEKKFPLVENNTYNTGGRWLILFEIKSYHQIN